MKHAVTKEINADLRTSRFTTRRPDKRESLAQIMAVANHASLVLAGKAKVPMIASARCNTPLSVLPPKFIPPVASAPVSNWSTPAQRAAKLARLISPRR